MLKKILKKLVILAVITIMISALWIQARESAYSCSGRCSGCTCWGFATDPFDECCGRCYHESWFGIYYTTCCIGGMGCHLDP